MCIFFQNRIPFFFNYYAHYPGYGGIIIEQQRIINCITLIKNYKRQSSPFRIKKMSDKAKENVLNLLRMIITCHQSILHH